MGIVLTLPGQASKLFHVTMEGDQLPPVLADSQTYKPNVAGKDRPSLGCTVALHDGNPNTWAKKVDEVRGLEGVDHLELWMESIPSPSGSARLARLLGGIACTAHAPFVDVSLVTQDEGFAKVSIDKLRRFVNLCNDLGVEAVAVHPGKYAVFQDKRAALMRLADRYHQLLDAADGMPIGLENLKHAKSGVSRNVITQVDDIVAFRSICPEATLTIDTGHAVQNGLDFESLARASVGAVSLMHLHDAERGGSSHRKLGSGDANLGVVSELIRALKPDYVTLEMLDAEDTASSLEQARHIIGSATHNPTQVEGARSW